MSIAAMLSLGSCSPMTFGRRTRFDWALLSMFEGGIGPFNDAILQSDTVDARLTSLVAIAFAVDLSDVMGHLDPEVLNCLKLNEYDIKAVSENESDKSTHTANARVSPRRNTATSAWKTLSVQKDGTLGVASEEEDEDLLVSAVGGFYELETEIIRQNSSNVEKCDGLSSKAMQSSKRVRKPKLALSLDYEAAVASINSAFESDKAAHQPASKKLRVKACPTKPSDSCESSPSNVNMLGLGDAKPITL